MKVSPGRLAGKVSGQNNLTNPGWAKRVGGLCKIRPGFQREKVSGQNNLTNSAWAKRVGGLCKIRPGFQREKVSGQNNLTNSAWAKRVGGAMQNSPGRKILPRFIILPWWIVLVILGVTAIISVSYSGGDEHEVPEKISLENQDVKHMEPEKSMSEEAALITQLQERLKKIQEREQRLHQRQSRLEGLQRDVEALAARQVKEAERLKKKAKELEGKENQVTEDDPSLVHLVKVYNAMDPEEAALRIEKMDEHLALEILAGIKDKKAAVVLAGVKPEKAALLTKGLRNFKKDNTN